MTMEPPRWLQMWSCTSVVAGTVSRDAQPVDFFGEFWAPYSSQTCFTGHVCVYMYILIQYNLI